MLIDRLFILLKIKFSYNEIHRNNKNGVKIRERGSVFKQKICPMLHWIEGKLNAKNQGPE